MKISVAMTTYNGGAFLEEQIQSILQQTLKPAEFIVCDDGSSDNTVEILKKHQEMGNLKYFVNPINLGLIENFKKAVSYCDPLNYISLSDQDDIWLPNKLAVCAEAMESVEESELPCMVHSDLIFIDAQKNVINQSFRNEAGQHKYKQNLKSLLFNNFVNGCTVLMNPPLRALFKNTPSNIYFNHDGWLALLAFTFGKVKGLKQPLVLYRKHELNFSIDSNKKPNNRYRNVYNQLLAAIKGKDDFLVEQFVAIRQFYDEYQSVMGPEPKSCFEKFLQLAGKPYFTKKMAYREMIATQSI